MATDTRDPEKGLLSTSASSAIPSSAPSGPNNDPSHASSRHTPLQLFQLLVGIETPRDLSHNEAHSDGGAPHPKYRRYARSENMGLYRRAKEQERSSRIAYKCTSFISNTLYMFQIILAATFTALSAYKDSSRVTLTVLGALNTVLAGSLAWQKGQGVPQRYRKAQDEYQALLLEIEMAERSFLDVENTTTSSGGSSTDPDGDAKKLNPRAETDRLQKLYDTARANQQANYPDLYVSTAGGTVGAPGGIAGASGGATAASGASGAASSGPSGGASGAASGAPSGAAGGKESTDLVKELEDTKAEALKVQSEMMAKIEALMAKLGGAVAEVGKSDAKA